MSNSNDNQDDNEEMSLSQYKHKLKMAIINLLVMEEMIMDNIELKLGFSLNDDDASEKLNQLSNIIEIPYVLYQYVA